MLALFVASEENPARCYEEEHEDDDPDTETDDGAIVWAWVGMNGYRSLDLPAGGGRRVDGDSGLD